MVRIGLAAALIVALAVPALADFSADNAKPLTATPDLLGPTGCIVTPTTEIAGLTYSGAYHWVNHTYNSIAAFNVAPIDQVEVGMTWLNPVNKAIGSHIAFNAKYLFTREHKTTPAVAVGAWDIGNQTNYQTFYAVISKTFGTEVPVIVNVGGAIGRKAPDGSRLMNGIFGSMVLRLRPQIDFLTEWDSAEINFGLRLRPYKGLTLDALAIDNGTNREFGAGASYIATF